MAALQVDIAGLHAVAASLRAAAQALADVSITPLAHPPLATDETSTSAAARLSEHGAVVTSRAADAAASSTQQPTPSSTRDSRIQR